MKYGFTQSWAVCFSLIFFLLMISYVSCFSITDQELNENKSIVSKLINKSKIQASDNSKFNSLKHTAYKTQDDDCGIFCYIGKLFKAAWWLIKVIFNFLISLPWVEIIETIIIVTIVGLIVLLIGYLVVRILVKIRQGSDFDYNIFDEPALTTIDKLNLNSISFRIPSEIKHKVMSVEATSQNNGECIEFNQGVGEFLAILLNTTVGYVSSYKYFEIDIIENPKESRVWIGLCEESNFNQTKLPNVDFSTVILDGESGNVSVGTKTRRFDFELRRFGENGGILLQSFETDEGTSKIVEVTPTCNGAYCINLEEPEDLKTQINYEYDSEK